MGTPDNPGIVPCTCKHLDQAMACGHSLCVAVSMVCSLSHGFHEANVHHNFPGVQCKDAKFQDEC
jgi:hypothetical protein